MQNMSKDLQKQDRRWNKSLNIVATGLSYFCFITFSVLLAKRANSRCVHVKTHWLFKIVTGSLSYIQLKSELHTTPTLYPISLIESHVGRLEDRQAATYTAHSAGQECIKTEAIALGWDETGAGMNVEARVRPHSSRSAQESFILRQAWEKSIAVIRPMEGGGERRLITRFL